jgi:signal transduction histidine kinase
MARHNRVFRSKTPSRNPVKRVRRAARSDRDTIKQLRQELDEGREQQTATADLLKVISSSTFDLQTVLDAVVETATRLCHAKRCLLFRRDGELYRSAAYYGFSAEFRAFHETHPIAPGRNTTVGRTALEGKTIHIPDVLADPEYTFLEAQKLGQYRANLGVPLLRGDEPIGALSLARSEPIPFTPREIELVETFAAQAVIAIENTRLLSELRESLQQQTATADVLKVIASSTGELAPVFNIILENAAHICEAKFGALLLFEGGKFRMVAMHNVPPAFAEVRRREPVFAPGPSNNLVLAVQNKAVQHIPDIRLHRSYIEREPAAVAIAEVAGARTLVVVPMLKDNEPIGAIAIYREEVRPFTDNQIELVKNFAAQGVIAIENARLLSELRERTHELAASLDDLRTTQDRLVQTQKLALLGQLTAGIAHEIKNPLNFVNNFSGISAELIDELRDALKGVSLDDRARTEIEELTDTLKGNFDKVVHHGRRADAIVKNMLQHSREGSGEHRVIDINALVEESLNLAWHGARAETQGFEIKLKQSFDPSAGGADVFPQDVRRALLNLISNGFYAATKRRAETNGDDFEPTLTASTKSLGDRVEIRIRDNGTGITPDVKEKMFEPFFTTKPTGEGTGLGLSISHDIIVKQHTGAIEVDTKPGEFTEIRIILPRVAQFV